MSAITARFGWNMYTWDMISLAVLPLLVSFAAPDLGPYRLEPWNDIRPSWIDPLIDSLRPGGSVTIFGERRLPDGTLSGRDTLRTMSVPSGIHEASVWWQFDRDTTHSTREIWAASRTSEIDSMTKEFFRGDSTTSWFAGGKSAFPGREIYWMNHGPKSSPKQQIDTTFKYFDAKGRTVATRTILHIFQSGGPGGFTEHPGTVRMDSIEWSSEGKPVRWCSFDSSRSLSASAYSVLREEHELTWDGYHLLRDFVRTWSRSEQGDTSSDTSTIELKWDGPRLLSGAEWAPNGRPIVRYGQTIAMWAWDSLGRMTRNREWGSETDLDSLIYGKGPWPERRLIHSCSNTEPFDFDAITLAFTPTKDDCELDETVLYTYAISNPSSVVKGERIRTRAHLDHGVLVLSGLEPKAHVANLIDPSGRILSRSPVEGGSASFGSPPRNGITLWCVFDNAGRRISSGRIVLP